MGALRRSPLVPILPVPHPAPQTTYTPFHPPTHHFHHHCTWRFEFNDRVATAGPTDTDTGFSFHPLAVSGHHGQFGIYTRTEVLPRCPAGDQPVFAVDRGIHRHASFRIAGRAAGSHLGYLTPFEHELDPATAEACGTGVGCEIEITMDGDRNDQIDGLIGAADLDTDGTNLGGWVGLNSHLRHYCRPAVHIDGGTATFT